jgi:hypothetical protein
MTTTVRSRFTIPGRLLTAALVLVLATCGKAAEVDSSSAAPASSPQGTAPAEAPETGGTEGKETAGGDRLERAARQSRQALDALEALVDGLGPDQRLDFDEPILQLESRREAALAAVADTKPAKLRKLVREHTQIAQEANVLKTRAEALTGGAG